MTNLQIAFCKEYVKTRNGLQSYKKIRPNLDNASCRQGAYQLLINSDVKNYIQELDDAVDINSVATRQYLIEEAHKTGNQALQDKQYGTKLYSIDLKAKLNRIYDKEVADLTQYVNLINELTINIDTDKPKTIDVEAEE